MTSARVVICIRCRAMTQLFISTSKQLKMKTTGHIPTALLLILLITSLSPIMADFNTVKNSCSGPCQQTVDYCKEDSQKNHPERTDNCVLLTSSVDGITPFQCLVRYGFCTENEFILLKNAACNRNDAQKSVSTATLFLYQELNTTSTSCHKGVITCVKIYSVATILKQQEYYCDLFNIQSGLSSSSACMINFGCDEAEFDRIKAAACKYSPSTVSQFAQTVNNTSSACKDTINNIDTCSASHQNVFQGIQREEYCSAMTFKQGNETTESCLVGSTKCTQDEFTRLKEAACPSNSPRLIFPSLTTLFYIAIYAASFNKLIFCL